MVNNKRSNLLKVWGYLFYAAAAILLIVGIYCAVEYDPALPWFAAAVSAIFLARLVFSGAVLVKDAEYRLHDRGDEAFTAKFGGLVEKELEAKK